LRNPKNIIAQISPKPPHSHDEKFILRISQHENIHNEKILLSITERFRQKHPAEPPKKKYHIHHENHNEKNNL